MWRGLTLALVGMVVAAEVRAAEIVEVTVDHEEGRYWMRSVTWFDAPRAGVFDVLTDYTQFERISSVYDESRFEEPAEDGTPRVYTRVEGCVLFFCQTMVRTEQLTSEGLDVIKAVTEPEFSDFSFAESTWQLEEHDGGTRVTYEIEMVPSFWVPPVLGPLVIKRKLRESGGDAVDRIEALANASTANADTFRERGLGGFDMDATVEEVTGTTTGDDAHAGGAGGAERDANPEPRPAAGQQGRTEAGSTAEFVQSVRLQTNGVPAPQDEAAPTVLNDLQPVPLDGAAPAPVFEAVPDLTSDAVPDTPCALAAEPTTRPAATLPGHAAAMLDASCHTTETSND